MKEITIIRTPRIEIKRMLGETHPILRIIEDWGTEEEIKQARKEVKK